MRHITFDIPVMVAFEVLYRGDGCVTPALNCLPEMVDTMIWGRLLDWASGRRRRKERKRKHARGRRMKR